MSCIVTLKINDYFPKIDSIPYENFICLFTYGDFFGKIPLIKKSNNICKHEIETINSDIKYNIHILEYNESSLIGICEMVIPFIKIKKINAPGTMVQEQKIKLIIDVNTKRKLFGKLINSDDIYLVLCAEVYIPDKKNIILNNDINNVNNIKKINNNKQIHVRISNKRKNIIMDGSPRTIKKRKMLMEMKSNREMIKKDISNDDINKNKYGNTNLNYNIKNNKINYDINDQRNSTGMFINKMKLDNQIKIIDFRNKNENIFNKSNENNLTTKELKKTKVNKKKSPKKKVTILELLEQKMQPLLSNNNNIINNRSNTYNSNESNIKQKSDNNKINNTNIKSGKKIIHIKSNNNNNICHNINNTIKKIIKKEENKNTNSNKLISSGVNSPGMIIISPNHNISSPNTINTNKIKRNNSKGLNRINKKYNNFNLYNFNGLNITDINNNNNNYNPLLIKNKRNSSQETVNRNKNKEKDNNKDSFKLGHYKRPKIDTSVEMFQRKSINKFEISKIKNVIKKNNSSYSNNAILSTEEITEQGLSEIDKIILEKGTELRDQFQNQLKNNIEIYKNNINNKIPKSNCNIKNDIKSEKISDNNIKNNLNQKIDKLYYDVGENQIIGGANYTIETPKTNKEIDCNNNTNNNTFDNKSSFCSSSQSLSYLFTQEDLKNNYIGLIELYYLLNQKLIKTIFENNDLNKKLNIFKENYNNLLKKNELIKDKNDKYNFSSFININLKHTLNGKIIEQLTYIKNLESKLYQDIFGYSYDDYEIIRTKEIERVNKLNEERKINLLLKVLKSIINDCGNVSQIFFNNKKKQNLLKYVLNKNNIKEKEEGEENYINLQSLNLNNDINYNYNKYHHIIEDDIFENKVIREVDEDKEEEESVYTASNKKKSNYHFYFSNNQNDSQIQNNESNHQTIKNQNDEKEIDNKINNEKENDNNNDNKKKDENNNNSINKSPSKIEENNDNINLNNNIPLINDSKNNNEEEENKKIEIMKDILINNFKKKYGKNNTFVHLDKNEFKFDDKYKIFVELINNNEIIIEIENNKYNIEEFISIYCKDDDNKGNIKKENFIYTKKIRTQQTKINNEIKKNNEEEIQNNNIHKRKRKRRIIDDDESEDENKNKEEEKEKSS